MRRFLLISGILLAAAQYVVAEEGKPVPAKDVKPSSVQLHDIVKVLVEDCPTAEGGPTHCKEIIASVEGIQPNGVLRIEGRNQTLVGDDVWERTVSGEVRPPSIRPDRTVRGEDVAKFHYKVCKRPMVHDAAAPGEVFPNPVLPHPVRQVAAETVESRKTAELRQKLAELNRLQREIRELRAETGTAQAIRVNVQMVEVNMTKLRQMKTDFSTADFGFVKMDGAGVLENPMQRADSKALIGFLDWLKENNIAKVLTRPTIVTMDGRPASMQVGEDIPLPIGPNSKGVEFKNVGIQLDVLPIALENDRVRLELKARISKRNDSRSIEVGDSRIPAVDVSQFDTAIETAFGQTVVLNGLTETRTVSIKTGANVTQVENQVELMLIVTPDLIEHPATAQRSVGKPLPK